MTTETETVKAPPTVAELEGKVKRLETQSEADFKASVNAGDAFAKAVKSGNVEDALKLADERGKANATSQKTAGQLKTAQNAVKSAKHAVNADAIAKLDDNTGKRSDLVELMKQYNSLGVERVSFESTEAGDNVLVNSSGPSAPRKARASSNGGNRGTASWEVGGQTFTSRELIEANLDKLTDKVREHYEAGNFRAFSMTREAERIHSILTS